MTDVHYSILALAALLLLGACAQGRIREPTLQVDTLLADPRPQAKPREIVLDGRIFLPARRSTMLAALDYSGPEADSKVPDSDRCVQLLLSRNQYDVLKRRSTDRIRVLGEIYFVSPDSDSVLMQVGIRGRSTVPYCGYGLKQNPIPILYVKRVETLPGDDR